MPQISISSSTSTGDKPAYLGLTGHGQLWKEAGPSDPGLQVKALWTLQIGMHEELERGTWMVRCLQWVEPVPACVSCNWKSGLSELAGAVSPQKGRSGGWRSEESCCELCGVFP
jgi:hypothetical protein